MNTPQLGDYAKQANDTIHAAHKSLDTEDLLDLYFNERVGYLFMLLFKKLNWKPNHVTTLSMGVGFCGGILMLPENIYLNILGMLLIVLSIILDATDGQLARLTHQTSELGRFLDGFSTFTWAAPAYICLGIRAINDPIIPFTNGTAWGFWVFLLVVPSGIFGMLLQCTVADYYRNAHLYFLNPEKSELTLSGDVKRELDALPDDALFLRRWYLAIYYAYTKIQEALSPNFVKLIDAINESGALTDTLRKDYLDRSKKYIQLTNIITINTRTIVLFACVSLNIPAVYFVADLFLFGIVLLLTINRYEKIAKQTYALHFADTIKQD
ncbi:MAG: CDP-alcohol phosphatidyltransferase family protein [Clostridiales bacterium]|nr:CDP-alcohol phosphatidyltransferase family protein [Candidatus Equinaster intestinalis]